MCFMSGTIFKEYFLLFLLFPTVINAAQFKGKVIHILDGDTIDVLLMQNKQPVRIRLANIDAPERKQAFGRWSGELLKRLIAGQNVTVTYSQHDHYGRVIGRIFTTNGQEVSRYMVQSGAAWVYERYNTDKSLPALQRYAKAQKYGLWADSNPIPPWEWRHKRTDSLRLFIW